MQKLLAKTLKVGEGRKLSAYHKQLAKISLWEEELKEFTDEELRDRIGEIKEEITVDTTDAYLAEVFAIVREAADRVLGMRMYDVQLLGALALHDGCVAEMRTGEGKTLTATAAVVLNALVGKGVHVVSVNDYLVKRDAMQMGRLYNFLGLSSGYLQNEHNDDFRRRVYACDIVYGTNSEFGFDYLRDNLATSKNQQVGRGRYFAIVDEIDSVLIDEARVPLIISGEATTNTNVFLEANTLVEGLEGAAFDAMHLLPKDCDFIYNEKKKYAALTERGYEKITSRLQVDNLFGGQHNDLLNALSQAVHAHALHHKDRDYLITDEGLKIVDVSTGRVLGDRQWSEGLHQAIEAKEGLPLTAPNRTIAQVTYQNFFRSYDKLAGMTGTGATETSEFRHVYGLDVVVVPTNLAVARQDEDDKLFLTTKSKWQAVVADIKECNKQGQPVLVGTVSVSDSELLSSMLDEAGIEHQVLNARPQHAAVEAETVAKAGRYKAVTVATNMAGRGVDIKLGGEPEQLAFERLAGEGLSVEDTSYQERFGQVLEECQRQCQTEGELVRSLGGLYVLGTERHQSRRIDGQLRGRSGRQGDPGRSCFYISAEDELLRLYGGAGLGRLLGVLDRLAGDDGATESKALARMVERAQLTAEADHFSERKRVLEYDDVLAKQRSVLYAYRQNILEDDNIEDIIVEQTHSFAQRLINKYHPETGEDPETLASFFPYFDTASITKKAPEEAVHELNRLMSERYQSQTELMPEELRTHLKRGVLLTSIDRHWQNQLVDLDYIKKSMGIRSLAQLEPVVEYRSESTSLFQRMLNVIWGEYILFIMQAKVTVTSADTMSNETTEVDADTL